MSGHAVSMLLLQVLIGRNFSQPIGYLKYEGPQTHFPLPVIIGIIAGASLLILIIVIICIAYHRKSQESDRVMKRMQNQMDKLEASVAKECKEGMLHAITLSLLHRYSLCLITVVELVVCWLCVTFICVTVVFQWYHCITTT